MCLAIRVLWILHSLGDYFLTMSQVWAPRSVLGKNGRPDAPGPPWGTASFLLIISQWFSFFNPLGLVHILSKTVLSVHLQYMYTFNL